jgi:hypothetical protein
MNTISKVLAVCFSFILLNAHAFDPINDDMAFILNYKMPFGKTLDFETPAERFNACVASTD